MLGVVHPDGVRDPARVRGRHVEVRVGVRVDIYLVPDITNRLHTMYMSDMCCLILEHQTKVREDFTITGKAPTRTSSRLKSASTFTFKTLC